MSEPRRWTIDICEACGVQRMIRGPYCPCGAGMEECEVIEAAPVEATLERLRKIETAAQLMLDSMDYELDLSDVTVLEQAEWSELVGCTRPANVWRLVKHSTENLREALGEPSDA